MLDIKVYVNGEDVPISSIINVSDRDAIEFEISSQNNEFFLLETSSYS